MWPTQKGEEEIEKWEKGTDVGKKKKKNVKEKYYKLSLRIGTEIRYFQN